MSGLLTLVLAESAVELVPERIQSHPAVVASARRRQREAAQLILDQNYHHAAIARLGKSEKSRGRPDIAHFSLLLALGTPLNMNGRLGCYVHTVNNKVIAFDPKTRLPRQTDRFISLLEQLYATGSVPPAGPPLLTLKDGTLGSLLKDSRCDYTVAFSTMGTPSNTEAVAKRLTEHERPSIIVGGFAEGHFSGSVPSVADEVVSIYPKRLEAWTVVSRALYDYERAVGL